MVSLEVAPMCVRAVVVYAIRELITIATRRYAVRTRNTRLKAITTVICSYITASLVTDKTFRSEIVEGPVTYLDETQLPTSDRQGVTLEASNSCSIQQLRTMFAGGAIRRRSLRNTQRVGPD